MLSSQVIASLKRFVEDHKECFDDDDSHGLPHALAVLAHVQRLVLYHPVVLSLDQIQDIYAAALLHDVDDRKFFPNNHRCENARKILNELIDDPFRVEQIIYIIKMVSTSTNGNAIPVPREDIWMLYPRFADRLEAIGKIGVKRCKCYSEHTSRPLYLPTTPRCATEAELWKVATSERFEKYLKNKESVSFIDHFYDKLLHIGTPEAFGGCDNPYLVREAADRHAYMVLYVLKFGRTGKIE